VRLKRRRGPSGPLGYSRGDPRPFGLAVRWSRTDISIRLPCRPRFRPL